MKNSITLFALVCLSGALKAQIVAYTFSGDATDVSGNGNNGTLSAGTPATTALKIGNNNTNYLNVPAAVVDGLENFSVVFKIQFTGFHISGASPTNHIFSGSSSGCVQCFGFSYEKAMNSWRLAFNGTTLNWTDPIIESKKWYCISIVKDGSSITLYKNGISLGTQTLATIIDVTSFVIGQEDDCVGGCFVANQSAWAHIDNFQVWEIPKTDCTININEFTVEGDQRIIEDVEEDIIIYPNPAMDEISIDNFSSDDINYSIRILDIQGKEVYVNNSFIGNINISNFTSGVYAIIFQNLDSDLLITRKFIKD